LVIGADERLEEVWGTASARLSSRGDGTGERLIVWGGAGLLRASEQERGGLGGRATWRLQGWSKLVPGGTRRRWGGGGPGPAAAREVGTRREREVVHCRVGASTVPARFKPI
jgi:hypothetical protein